MKYIEKLLKRFGMLDVKPVKNPVAAHFQFSKDLSPQIDEDEKYMSCVLYDSAVRSIIDAMVCTRPDFLYTISAMS